MKFVEQTNKWVIAHLDPKKVPPSIFPITGIDPGGTTGLVVVSGVQEMPEFDDTVYRLSVDWGTYSWPQEAEELWGAVRGPTVVMEDWRLQAHKKDYLVGQKMVGPEALGFIRGSLVKLYGWDTQRSEAAHLYMYQPSQRFKDEEVRRLWGELAPTNEHARCALAIVMTHLAKVSQGKIK